MYTHTTIDTPVGEVKAVFTSGNHVHLHASGPINEPDPEKRKTVTAYGVEYTASLHLFLQPDGSWTTLRPGQALATPLYGNRVKSPSGPITGPARKRIAESLTEALTEFVAEHPEILAAAAEEDAARRVEAARRTVEQAEAELEAAHRELREAVARQSDFTSRRLEATTDV